MVLPELSPRLTLQSARNAMPGIVDYPTEFLFRVNAFAAGVAEGSLTRD
jgi:hypothetical protein